MATFKSISASQVVLGISILVILMSSANGTDVCSATDAGAEKTLCMQLVKGATTREEALTNVVHAIMDEAKKNKPMFDGIRRFLPPDLKPVSKDSILSTCKDAFENLSDNMYEVLGNIKTGDPMQSIDVELSAASSALSDCTDGLDEFGVNDPEVNKARDTVQKYASISLAVSSIRKH